VLCREQEEPIHYRSDSLGFRNDDAAWNARPLDAAIIGDSFAQGFCRPATETIASVLNASGVRSINAGLAGAGPLTELGVMREFVLRAHPSAVYWLFYEGNDLVDLESEKQTSLIHYLDSGYTQHLYDRRKEVSESIRSFADSSIEAHVDPSLARRVWGFVVLRNLRTATGLYRSPVGSGMRNESAELELLGMVLSRAATDARASGSELRIVYLPERRRFNPNTRPVVGENHDPREVERAVLRLAGQRGISVLNVASAFGQTPDAPALWNNRRYHYNRKGYALVAKMILSDLANRPDKR